MIGVIQDETSKAVELMEVGNKKTASGMLQTQEVNKAFMQITGSIGNVSEKVQDVSTAVVQLSASSTHIVHVLQVKQFSIESMAASQESSAATEQQLAAMEEIASSSESLSRLSEELRTLVMKFNA